MAVERSPSGLSSTRNHASSPAATPTSGSVELTLMRTPPIQARWFTGSKVAQVTDPQKS